MIKALRLSSEETLRQYAELIFLHNGKADMCTSFLIGERAELKIKLPVKYGATELTVEIYDEALKKRIAQISGEWCDRCEAYDIYIARIDTQLDDVGLYYAKISIKTLLGVFYGDKNEDKLFFSANGGNKLIQLSISDFKYKAPTKLKGGIIYHIFVDRFSKGKKGIYRKDSILIDDWDAELPEYPEYPGARVKNNYFYGGNLYGVIDRLEYLKSIGVSIIYLSPIFESPSNHKYDTSDYLKVDGGFGGEESLKELIAKANKMGMSIILDGVFNHTGADSLYFNRYGNYNSIGAYQSKDSQFFSWYHFDDHPNKYTAWWGIEILPRINPDLPDCGSFFTKNGGVIDKYASLGIAGFRLDVVDELSDRFVSDIKARLNERNDESVLYGEVWEDASNKIAYDKRKKYYLGDELDGVMNYPLRRALISYFRESDAAQLREYLFDILPNMPKRIRDLEMNLLGSHDTERILTALAGKPAEGYTNSELLKIRMSQDERSLAIKRLKMAYTTIATLPGIPSIYYGDEAGMEGYSDPFCRRTYPWGRECYELINHYKCIAQIRNSSNVFKDGDFSVKLITDELFIFERYSKSESYLTVVNNSKHDIRISFLSKVVSGLNKLNLAKHTVPCETADVFIIGDTRIFEIEEKYGKDKK